jgi:predicted DNA-binding protein
MAKVIDIAGVKRADALVADALRCNPHVLDRLTIEDIEMALNEETVVVSVRMPKELAEKAESLARKLAYNQNRRITRTSLIVDIIERGISEIEDEDATDRAALALADTGDFEDWNAVKARNGL